MFRAIGFVIIVYSLSTFFSETFVALEQSSVAVLETIEVAATVSTSQLENVNR